jgi:hypothetical protein
MNKYRCETCNSYEDDDGKAACNIREEWISEDVWKWIKVVGCASHSDIINKRKNDYDPEFSTCRYCGAHKNEFEIRKDERERLLDEIKLWLNCASEFVCKTDGTGYAVVRLDDIIRKLIELCGECKARGLIFPGMISMRKLKFKSK